MTTSIEDRRARLNRWREDLQFFVNDTLHITTKDSKIIKMGEDPRFPEQPKLFSMIQRQREQRRPVRIVALKPRQIGFTSASAAAMFHATALFPNVETQLVSMDLESVKKIHGKNEIFHEMMPDGMRPMLDRSNSTEMVFRNPRRKERSKNPGLRSRIFVQTAKTATIGRSKSIQNFHGSEVAFWSDGADRGLAAMNSIPDIPKTTVIMESTGNGIGDYFYELVMKAQSGKSEWSLLFFSWLEHGEYVRPCCEKYNGEDLDQDELDLVENFGATKEQIAWRRFVIENKCNGEVEQFRQEFPNSVEEAFIVSGRPAFDFRMIRHQEDFYALEPRRMSLELTGAMPRGRVRAPIVGEERFGAPFLVWKPPVDGHLYTAFADCAKGVDGGDFQCCVITDVLTKEMAAALHYDIGWEQYAEDLILLCAWYNNALLAVEKNGCGQNVLSRIMDRYSNLYYERRIDDSTGQQTKYYGFWTDDRSKPILINEYAAALRAGECRNRSYDSLDEMKWYARDQRGRYVCPKGKHDDWVIGTCGSYWLARQQPVREAQIEQPDAMLDPVLIHLPLHVRLARYASEQRNANRRDGTY